MFQQNAWRSAISLVLCVGFAVGVVSTIAWTVIADGNPLTDDVPRMIPYQGVLELDGQPVHATGDNALAIQFALYDSADNPTPVYIQNLTVEVFSGRFTTAIGPTGNSGEAITDVIQAADDLHLGMTLLNSPGVDDDVIMANRQRILATPYAMWSTSATNLTVANNATVGGDLSANNVHINSTLNTTHVNTVSMNIKGSDLVLGSDDNRTIGLKTGQRALVHEGDDSLTINYDGDFEGGTHINSELDVAGNMNVAGGLNVEGIFSGRVVGGGSVHCTGNARVNEGCRAWGTANCDGSGCRKYQCARGNLVSLWENSISCHHGDWHKACFSMLCVEDVDPTYHGADQ